MKWWTYKDVTWNVGDVVKYPKKVTFNGETIWKRLPPEYLQVEYLESTGTLWIDTDVMLQFPQTFELKVKKTNYTDSYLCGVRFDGTASRYVIGNLGSYYYSNGDYGYTNVSWGTTANIVNTWDENRNLTFTINNNTYTYNSKCSDSIPSNATHYIFGGHYCNTDDCRVKCAMKLYYFKIRNGNNLVLNLIPCYRKSDHVAGMYDLVNDVFYTNSGSGEFIVGPDCGDKYVWWNLVFKSGSTVNSRLTWEDNIGVYNGIASIDANNYDTATYGAHYDDLIDNHIYMLMFKYISGDIINGNLSISGYFNPIVTVKYTPNNYPSIKYFIVTKKAYYPFYRSWTEGTEFNNLKIALMCIDLTEMFGAGNEPTIDEFKLMFPDEYYPYNSGEWRKIN